MQGISFDSLPGRSVVESVDPESQPLVRGVYRFCPESWRASSSFATQSSYPELPGFLLSACDCGALCHWQEEFAES